MRFYLVDMIFDQLAHFQENNAPKREKCDGGGEVGQTGCPKIYNLLAAKIAI